MKDIRRGYPVRGYLATRLHVYLQMHLHLQPI